jgi:hypothetical protein
MICPHADRQLILEPIGHDQPPSANSALRTHWPFGALAPRTHIQVSDLDILISGISQMCNVAGHRHAGSSPSRTLPCVHALRSGVAKGFIAYTRKLNAKQNSIRRCGGRRAIPVT